MHPETTVVSPTDSRLRAAPPGEYRNIPASAWRKSAGTVHLPGRGDRAWLRVRLQNSGDAPRRVLVRYETPWTDRVWMAALDDSGAVITRAESGDAYPDSRRMERPLLALELPPRSNTLILARLENPRRAAVDLKLYTPETYRKTAFREWILQGLLCGGGFMLLAFHVSIYLAIRDRLLARYIAYLAFAGIYLLLRSGLMAHFLPGGLAAYSNTLSSAAVAGLYYSGIRFAREFLQLGSLWPRVDGVLKWIQRLALAMIPLYAWDRYLAVTLEDMMGLLAGAPLLAIGALSARRNAQRSLYFLAGWSLPVMAALLESLRAERIISDFPHSAAVLPAAMLLEFILFAGVLRNRLARIREERVADGARMARIEKELDLTRRIQRELLPPPVRAAGSIRLQAACESARAVGGGYYDYWQAGSDAAGVLIAGAQGGGLPAALDASLARLAFRTASGDLHSPTAALASMSRFLGDHLAGRVVRAAYAVVDSAAGIAHVASAGVRFVYVYRSAGGVLERLDIAGPPLGSAEGADRVAERVLLAPGDALVLLADGFLQEHEDEVRLYNLEQACRAALQHRNDVSDVCAALLARLQQLQLPGEFDLTLAVVQRTAEDAAP